MEDISYGVMAVVFVGLILLAVIFMAIVLQEVEDETRREKIGVNCKSKQAIQIIETKAWANDASLEDLLKLSSSPYMSLRTALKLLEQQGVKNEN